MHAIYSTQTFIKKTLFANTVRVLKQMKIKMTVFPQIIQMNGYRNTRNTNYNITNPLIYTRMRKFILLSLAVFLNRNVTGTVSGMILP